MPPPNDSNAPKPPKRPSSEQIQREVEVTHVKGSGPGGQNRNKRMSGVRVVHEPTGIVVRATERRSQAQNLESAMQRLEEKIEKTFHRPKKRRPTRKTRSSQERRLHGKSKRAAVKKDRGRVRDD